MSTESNLRIPYPGPRSFDSNEQNLFFGREREVLELVSLVTAHQAVLIYAQSGAGKTSLLNAGLIPVLRSEGFEVLPVARTRGLIREGIDIRETTNIYVFNTLMSWLEDRPESILLKSMSIATFLKGIAHPMDGQGLLLPRIAIFDQFEELFTFYPEHWKEREGFFRQIAEALDTDPLLRVLFVMREDYLASLDPYTRAMPDQLRNRFHLELLRAEPATLAVERPVISAGRSFALGVAQELVQELLKIKVKGARGETVEATGEFVEPVQLQVICQNLWLDLPPDTKLITFDHLKAFGNVDEALKGFYEHAVRTTIKETRVSEGELRNWFEQHLITTAGTRGTIFRGKDRTQGIPNAAVDTLENQHLIRAEIRAGARWYELTHDRFINSIQTSNRQWRLTHSRRLFIVGSIIGFALFTIMLALGVYAWNANQIAQQKEATALQQAYNAQQLSALILTNVPASPTMVESTPILIMTLTPSSSGKPSVTPTLSSSVPTPNYLATIASQGSQTNQNAARETAAVAATSAAQIIGTSPLMFVPAGEFLMGSNDGASDEKPVHTVDLDMFWIDKYEVTNALYKRCVDAGRCQKPAYSSSYSRNSYYGNSQFGNFPVIAVTWDDAKKYCEWAGRRLPTEAEWQKAARGTDGRIFPWGNAFDSNKLNSLEGGIGDTAEIGSYSGDVSPYGVMDMAGNVAEWVLDWYAPGYYANSPRNNPTGPSFGQYRVVSGGAWNFNPDNSRLTNRYAVGQDTRHNFVGFRCVMSFSP